MAIRLIKRSAISYLQSDLLSSGLPVKHAFSTRLGGVSTGSFASLNTAFQLGDRDANVLENRRRFFSAFKYDFRKIIAARQVHGATIGFFDAEKQGQGALPRSFRENVDALVTDQVNLPLTAYSADCLIIFVTALTRPLVALAHAGWRGSLAAIASKMVQAIDKRYAVKPDQLLVSFSPALCPSCLTVGEDVASAFAGAGWSEETYLPRLQNGQFGLDLVAINACQLKLAGIKDAHLEVNRLCTACDRDHFYSYRRDQGCTGRMIAFIAAEDSAGGVTSEREA